MLQKLQTGQYDVLKHYRDLDIFPLISSVCLQMQPGSVYVDDVNDPRVIFVVHNTGFSYLFHKAGACDYNAFFNFVTQVEDVPQYFHIYKPAEELIRYVSDAEGLGYKLRERVQLRYFGKDKLSLQPGMDASATLYTISADNISLLKNLGIDLIRNFWNTEEAFLANGYGVFLADDTSIPLSLCYSAGCTSHLSEIDIITKDEYRGRGLAKTVTAAYINLSIEKNILPNWDCFSDNIASYKTAISLGFETMMTYKFLSVFIKNR